MKRKNVKEIEKTEQITAADKLNIRDGIIMLVFVIIYAALLFFRLGSSAAPQSGYIIPADNTDGIVLTFDEKVSIDKACIYLGHTATVHLNIDATTDGGAAWEPISVKHAVDKAFYWNTVVLNSEMNGMRITHIGKNVQIMELVFLDKEGNTIVPSNIDAYPELFDEQDLYVSEPTYYHHTMFDEIYHARTAYEFINGYEIYEITHPHLGKSIMTLGIRLFGMTPFGWRFMCVIFGLLAVPLMYLMAFHFTRKRDVTVLATILLCTQFMHFTLSRIGTIDVIVSLFIMLMFYFMARFVDALKKGRSLKRQFLELFICGCATACAVSTKWTGLYAMAGIGVIFFACLIPQYISEGWTDETNKKLLILGGFCVVVFVVLPLGAYITSFAPMLKMYPDKNIFQIAEANSRYMLNYHSNISQYHIYASKIYEWLLGRGALVDASARVGNKMSYVVTLGSPFIAITGLAALVHNLYLWFKKKDTSAKILSIAYFAMVLPWVFISRTQFVYQYYVCTLLLGLLIANSVNQFKDAKRKRTIIIIAVVSAVFFAIFYPVISGMLVSPRMFNYLLFWN